MGGGVCKVIFLSNPTIVLRLGWGFDNMQLWSINVNLRLLKASIEFLWVLGGWWGLQSHFHGQPNRCVEVTLGF